LTGSLWLFLLPRLLQGISRGGGVLAWQLGHHDFADRRMVALYMGIHVTLTGVRGAIGAYLAVLMLDGVHLEGLHITGMGSSIFLVTAILTIISQFGFITLDRSIRHQSKP